MPSFLGQVTFQARDTCGRLLRSGGYQELRPSLTGPLEVNTTTSLLSTHDVGDGTYVIPFMVDLCGNYSLRVETKSVDLMQLQVWLWLLLLFLFASAFYRSLAFLVGLLMISEAHRDSLSLSLWIVQDDSQTVFYGAKSPFWLPVKAGHTNASNSFAYSPSGTLLQMSPGVMNDVHVNAIDNFNCHKKWLGDNFESSLVGIGYQHSAQTLPDEFRDGAYVLPVVPLHAGPAILSVMLDGEEVGVDPSDFNNQVIENHFLSSSSPIGVLCAIIVMYTLA